MSFNKLAVVSATALSLALAAPVLAADVGANIGTNVGVQTGPTAGTVGGEAGVHSSTSTGTTGVNQSVPTGVDVNSGMSGTAATATDTEVNAPSNTMAKVTTKLSSDGYTNVQRYNDAQASTNNNLAFTAKNKTGKDVLVTVDSQTGAVISESPRN
jgi:hypothetical protein